MAYSAQVKQYFKEAFLFDLKAGFITAVVALPLAIGFAIASGVHPIMGLYTAIIAGILGSAFGGSVYSITGPTGAMTIVILSTLNQYGLEGLLLAGFLTGLIQIIFGLIKIGKIVKFVPLPIVSGFTAGIGAIIFIGQIANGLGLQVAAKEHIWETAIEIFKQLGNINFLAVAITLGTILILVFLPKLTSQTKWLKALPASIVALLLATILTYVLALNVPQVGEIPSGLPTFSLIKKLARNPIVQLRSSWTCL